MLIDPTTIEPTTTEPAPASPPRRRRRRAALLGAAVVVLAIVAASFALARGESGPEPVGAAAPTTEVAQPSTTSTTAAEVSLASGDGTDPVAAPSGALLSIAPASGLSFVVGTDELVMTVRNEGDVAASWAIELSGPEVTVSPSEGTLDPGQAVDLTVTADRTDLGNGVTYYELDVVTEADLAHGDKVYPVFVAVEKAEVTTVGAGPQVICALQSPGAGPKVAVIVATGIHLEKADTIWAEIQTPGPKVFKAMDFDEAHDRWVATYSSTTLGAHLASAGAAGSEATGEPAGAVPINVIWCP